LLDVFAGRNNVNMVLEYCITDLEEIIRDRSIILTPAEVKCCMEMIVLGLAACHKQWTLHRDLKPSNILVGADGQLKLADFGLARIHGSPNPRMTHQVITRWYRPPELLYSADQYSAAVDMWSVGCIFAELMLRMPYIPGDSDIDQLARIFQARGTPTDETWPERKHLPSYISFTPCPEPDHRMLFTASSPAALDLLNKMMTLNPLHRLSADEVLEHTYFKTEQPMSCTAEALLAKIMSSQTIKKRSNDSATASAPATAAAAFGASMTKSRLSPKAMDGAAALGKRKLEF
jgi:cyclin-dependent kinase 7